MSPIRSEQNLYPGINPHLNSHLQSEDGGWESFHAEHIVAMARILDQCLPDHYYAIAEKSLQISEFGLATDTRNRIRPDVSIYRSEGATRASPTSHSSATNPIAILDLEETLDEEDDLLTAVVIYELVNNQTPGRIVTRLELLSPANKPPQAHYRQYLAKRRQTLRSGLNMVEIDYLHEQRPILKILPSYSDGDAEAYPYTILVSNPHPTPEAGNLTIYGFHAVDPLPTVVIPLSGADNVVLDFGEVYRRAYEGVRFYQVIVDYAQEPIRFATYSPLDQERIRRRMSEIAVARRDTIA